MNINCLNECEVLALSTAVSSEWAKCTPNTDELMFWGEFLTSVGTNLIVMADQRIRKENCEQGKPKQKN